MVLFSFSNPYHVPLIRSGNKKQTTRIPRKPYKNGSPAYKVGDKVQLYYRSRQKASCVNCLTYYTSCIHSMHGKETYCNHWYNFFGESEILEIHHYRHGLGMLDLVLGEYWHNCYLGELSDSEKELWAKADGFESWVEANQWFKKSTKFDLWAYQSLDVIIWNAEPIIKSWHKHD